MLRAPAEAGQLLPRAALEVVREWEWQLDEIVTDGARFWGGGGEAEFWAVPGRPARGGGLRAGDGRLHRRGDVG